MTTKKIKPVEMFEMGKEELEKVNKKTLEKKIMGKNTDFSNIKVKTTTFRKARGIYEFLNLEIEGLSLAEIDLVQTWVDHNLTYNADKATPPAINMPIVDVPAPIATDSGLIGENPFEYVKDVAFDGQCKYCKSGMWDNTAFNQDFPKAKPKWKCKDKACGYMYMIEDKNWFKPDPNYKKS